MTLPWDAGECWWSLARAHSTHLARRTEGVVGFKVCSDRAGIVLLHGSSPLVLLNNNNICLSPLVQGAFTIEKRLFSMALFDFLSCLFLNAHFCLFFSLLQRKSWSTKRVGPQPNFPNHDHWFKIHTPRQNISEHNSQCQASPLNNNAELSGH